MKNIKKLIHKNILPYFIDCLLAITLIVLSILESNKKVLIAKNTNVAFDIIVSMIPAIITIISVAIPIQHEHIRGIPLREFERLRKRFYFNLLHMSIIIVFIFAIETVLILFKLKCCLLVLDGISILYSLIFLAQEIPILTKSDSKIDKVLKFTLKNGEVNSQDSNSNAQIALTNTLMNYGLRETMIKFSSKKTKKAILLQSLLYLELSYYTSIIENIIEGDKKETVMLYDINILKAIDNSYDDLLYLFDEKNENNTKLLTINEKDNIFLLTRLTYLLKSITDKLNYTEKNRNHIKRLIDFLNLETYSKKVDDYNSIFKYLLLMSISTIKNGEVWFIAAIRDRTFAPYFFNPFDTPLSFLLTMYMCFFINSDLANETKKSNINDFLMQHSIGLNSGGYTWLSKIRESLRHDLSGVHFLNGVLEMLKVKELIDNYYYEITPEFGGSYTIDDSSNFSNELFFDYCLQVLLFGYFHSIKYENIENFISKLSPDNKTVFIHTFEGRYSNARKKEPNHLFYKFIFNAIPERDLADNNIYQLIDKYITTNREKEYENDDSVKFNDQKLMNIKEKLDTAAPSFFGKIDFFDDGIEMDDCKKQFSYFVLDANDYDELLNLQLKQLPFLINNIVKKDIVSKVTPQKIHGNEFDTSTINEIIAFKPDYYSNTYRLSYDITKEQRSFFESVKRVTRDLVPIDTFFKTGAIRIKFEYSKEDSNPRLLKDEEINDIIDHEYTLINGYYRYGKYKGSPYGNFYVTRDKLAQYIHDRYAFIPIVFTYKVIIDEDKIRYYKFDND